MQLYLGVEVIGAFLQSLHIPTLVSDELDLACADIIQQLMAAPTVLPLFSQLLDPLQSLFLHQEHLLLPLHLILLLLLFHLLNKVPTLLQLILLSAGAVLGL